MFGTRKPDPGGEDEDEDEDNPVEMENRHARQSAEILSHLITDTERASQVRTLEVWAPEDSKHVLFSLFMGALTFPAELPPC